MHGAEWILAWWTWSAPSTLQASLLLAAAWIADRLLVRRVWPQLLSLFWLLALARFFLPPNLCSPLSVTAALGAPTLAAAKLSPGGNLLEISFAIWLAGVAALIVARCASRARLASSLRWVEPSPAWRKALSRASRRLGSRGVPRVGTMNDLATGAVFGSLRPTLLLPTAWLERAPTRRDEHALLHELAHLERGDLWLDEFCALVRAALWFHPLAWIAVARLRALSELQCDQTVARALGCDADSYRDTLIFAARDLVAAGVPSGVRAFIAHPSAIIVRIECLERTALRSRPIVRGVSAAFVFALAACVLPMAPRAADLRAQALNVFAAESRGEKQSCFVLQAAAMVLAADPKTPSPDH